MLSKMIFGILVTWFFIIFPELVLHVYELKKITDGPSNLSAYDLYIFMYATKFSVNHKEKKYT